MRGTNRRAKRSRLDAGASCEKRAASSRTIGSVPLRLAKNESMTGSRPSAKRTIRSRGESPSVASATTSS